MNLDEFTRAYIGAALWSSVEYDENGNGGEPLDSNYDESDLAPETLETMRADCADFQAANAELLESAYAAPEYDAETGKYNKPHYDESQAGHDFWLTRNHHGAGFWDRGLGAIGKRLTDMAHPYGSCDLYVGDDGRIYSQ